jgi:hypothetical protein
MAPFYYNVRGDVLVITGYLDEHADFSRIAGAFDKVNLQGVDGFSSMGLRQFMHFLYERDSRSIALQDCPVPFIEAINAISALIRGTKITVESLMVPFVCHECPLEIEVLVKTCDVLIDRASVKMPMPRCHKCQTYLEIQMDPHEYFLFLYD